MPEIPSHEGRQMYEEERGRSLGSKRPLRRREGGVVVGRGKGLRHNYNNDGGWRERRHPLVKLYTSRNDHVMTPHGHYSSPTVMRHPQLALLISHNYESS
jgi:hypothetical protein